MSETIVETILPGVYIEVRAEGLLTVGAISTGNVGVIGTAQKGGKKIENLSSFDDGRAKFGRATTWDPSANGSNMTLVRSLKLLFDNGARTVYARRVFDEESALAAGYELKKNSTVLLKLKAKTPGTWGNELEIRVEDGETQELVSNELVAHADGTFALSAGGIVEPQSGEEAIGSVKVSDRGVTKKYLLKTGAASGTVVQVDTNTRGLTFATQPPATAEVRASYWVPKEHLRKVTFQYGTTREVYTVSSAAYLEQLIMNEDRPSKLVECEGTPGKGLPDLTERFDTFVGGEDGSVDTQDYIDALDDLVDEDIQIVVACGPAFSDIKSQVLGHVEKTENLGKERLAVVGVDRNDVEKVLENVNEVADKRVLLVAPGLKQKDPVSGRVVDLPPYFAAAAVAGRLSSISPHVSLTNKTLKGIDELSVDYNYGQMKSLVDNRVLVLEKKRGLRVVKGITTHDGAWKQASVRRIVDYIKEGTRRGAAQYIGRLNNARVRGALHTTLDGFLTDMVTREFLTGYKLEVFADRPMELRGEVLVTMDLNPTFSIDVIRVIMNLS
jgi:hypothetical protein